MEKAVFGGGCFWCTEAVFQMLRGVKSTTPGYAGPTEVLQIEYDPAVISYRDLLTVFFGSHDPTSFDRQGADTGPAYRSMILYTTDEQKREAEKYKSEIDGAVTEIKPLEKFTEAEEFHKNYYRENSSNAYCQLVINPKLEKVQKEFADLLART